MSYKLEPNNNDSAGPFSTTQQETMNKLKKVSGQSSVPLTDDRKLNMSRGGQQYAPKFRKTDKGKYIRNTSPASLNKAINQSTSDKYSAINKKIDKSRQTVKGTDVKRAQNYNPYYS